jgi:hypothetical protein
VSGPVVQSVATHSLSRDPAAAPIRSDSVVGPAAGRSTIAYPLYPWIARMVATELWKTADQPGKLG